MIGKPYEYEAMATCEKDLWWYKCLHDNTLQAIQRHRVSPDKMILDAGCGTGGLLKKLISKGYKNLHGFDLSEDALQFASASTGLDLKLYDIQQAAAYYEPNTFDVIVSHDIVCLLPEGKDVIAIDQLFRILKPGGLLIINLPALNAFRGTHDLAVGITKRYNRSKVQNLVAPHGKIESIIYWPFILSLPVYLTRLWQRTTMTSKKDQSFVSDVKMPAKVLNQLFYKISHLESAVFKNKPWGSSLFTVIKKH
jgi:SAM-dependent methyltransferase